MLWVCGKLVTERDLGEPCKDVWGDCLGDGKDPAAGIETEPRRELDLGDGKRGGTLPVDCGRPVVSNFGEVEVLALGEPRCGILVAFIILCGCYGAEAV